MWFPDIKEYAFKDILLFLNVYCDTVRFYFYALSIINVLILVLYIGVYF